MILIIDDDKAVQISLRLLLSQSGYQVSVVSHPREAFRFIEAEVPELVVLDMNFSNDTSGQEGLFYLEKIKPKIPGVPFILLTAWASIPLAVEGIKMGAFDFVSKPWDNRTFIQTIRTALNLHSHQKDSFSSRQELDTAYDFQYIVGETPEMLSILETIGRISKTDAPVLILGETGTGKEIIAEAIHNNSLRKKNPFVKVNLGGIASTLFESEMFGHKKGAFTDAYNDRQGRFELAHTGTIFLDEIGELDLSSQVKLLRVLQDKTYQVLGESKTLTTDVRVVCATNKNLKKLVENGEFREDLFYRINLITIELPALRNRRHDIPLLVDHFLQNVKKTYGLNQLALDEDALAWCAQLPFPGNIRELKNLVERSYLLAGTQVLTAEDLKETLQQTPVMSSGKGLPPAGSITLEELEKQMIMKTMDAYKNNISKVAKTLGLSRGALYRRLDKYGISYETE
jgi:two-component system, NtrC family, response regulator